MDNLPEDVDEDLFNELKEEYYQATKLVRAANPKLDEAMCKAAILCAEHGIDADTYIAAQVRHYVPRYRGQKHMEPADFISKSAVANVSNFLNVSSSCTWKGSWENQMYYLSAAVKNTNRTIEEILLDHNICFRPWFRCLITKEAIPSVIKKYGYQASLELKLHDLQVFLEQLKREKKLTFDFSRIPEYR